MFEPVFVTRDTEEHSEVTVTLASVGVVKVKGCVIFWPAVKDSWGEYGDTAFQDCADSKEISLSACKERYSSVPERGEAWLVEEGRKYINWTRVDRNMHLLDEEGNIMKE